MAEQTLNVTVVDVTHRSGTSKKNGKPYNLYLVKLSDGNEYKTFDNELGTQANQAKGTPVKATVEAQQRDGFPDDLFLKRIEPTSTPVAFTEEAVVKKTNSPFVPSNGGGSRNDDIRAQMAFKAAMSYVAHNGTGSVEDDFQTVKNLAKLIYLQATAEALTASESPTKVVTEQW